MSLTTSKSALAAALLILSAPIAKASPAGRHHSYAKSAEMYVYTRARVPGGLELKPGDYKVTLLDRSSSPQIAFYYDERLVGKTTAQLVSVEKAPDHTSVHYKLRGQTDRVISEIDVKGWTQKIVFGPLH